MTIRCQEEDNVVIEIWRWREIDSDISHHFFFFFFSHMKCTESILFTPLCNIYIDRNKALVMRYTVC